MNPRNLASLLKRFGIRAREIEAKEVIVKPAMVVKNPRVVLLEGQGEKTLMVTGEFVEVSEEDVRIVMEKTGVDEETARKALIETGDLVEAIEKLSLNQPPSP